MGKYDAVLVGLPRLPPEVRYSDKGGAAYQDIVNEAKQKFDGKTPDELVKVYADARAEKDRLEEELSAASVIVEAAAQLLMETYEGKGITSMNVKGVGTVRADHKPHSHVVDKEAYHQWCIESGFQDQMHLMWQTTNSIVTERLLSGQPKPPGVDVYMKPTPVLTREK